MAALPGPGKRGIVPDNTSNMCSLEKIKGRKLPAVLPLRKEFLRTFEDVHVDMRVDTHTYIHSFLENWLIQFLLFKNNLK